MTSKAPNKSDSSSESSDNEDKPPKARAEGKPFERKSGTNLPPPTTPQLTRRDPSIPAPASSSKTPAFDPEHTENPSRPWHKKCSQFMYDKQKGTYCGRTCLSWAKIIGYAIMYLIFLMTYTMILLYCSLLIIRNKNFQEYSEDFVETSQLVYSSEDIGLSGVPLEEHSYPLIWYRTGEADDYNKYVSALDELLEKHRQKRDLASNLGPCGKRPYGYGENPCIIVRINKHFKWAGKPLQPGSPKAKEAPEEVQNWIQRDSNKYWLHCKGFHNYDREHIGKIQYYPDPPGFDSSLFPMDIKNKSPLVAFQISNFTLGISLAIECKMWFESGQSSVTFMLYVSPKSKNLRSASRWKM